MSILSITLSTGDVAFYTLLSYAMYKLYEWVRTFVSNMYTKILNDFQKPITKLNNTISNSLSELNYTVEYSTNKTLSEIRSVKQTILMVQMMNQLQKIIKLLFPPSKQTTSDNYKPPKSCPFDFSDALLSAVTNPIVLDIIKTLTTSSSIGQNPMVTDALKVLIDPYLHNFSQSSTNPSDTKQFSDFSELLKKPELNQSELMSRLIEKMESVELTNDINDQNSNVRIEKTDTAVQTLSESSDENSDEDCDENSDDLLIESNLAIAESENLQSVINTLVGSPINH